jgi:hypothetical protein
LAQAKNDRDFLRQLPARWKKSAAVLACMGVVGGLMLPKMPANASYLPQLANPDRYFVERRVRTELCCNTCRETRRFAVTRRIDISRERWENVCQQAWRVVERRVLPKHNSGDCRGAFRVRTLHEWCNCCHEGGSGFAVYVVHFTEAEAWRIILQRLEEAGLQLEEAELPYEVAVRQGINAVVNASLLDSERNVAVGLVPLKRMEWSPLCCCNFERDRREMTEQSRESGSNLTFGLFVNPLLGGSDNWSFRDNPQKLDRINERHLNRQIDLFIQRLQEEGILYDNTDTHEELPPAENPDVGAGEE